jgi:hypothetical protein
VAVVLVGVLAACGAAPLPSSPLVATVSPDAPLPSVPASVPHPTEAPPLEPVGDVPRMTINDVAGSLVSYCWADGCADGVLPDPSTLDPVTPPFGVRMPAGGTIEHVVAVGPNPADEHNQIDVEFEGSRIGELPEGTVMIQVSVTLAPAGSAFFVWAIAP